MLKSVSPLFLCDRNCEQKQGSPTPTCERTLFLSFGCPMHWRSQLCDSCLVKCREVFFHLVQGECDRVGHLPFRYFFHQVRQVHLVVVIVCLVILPASCLRLHLSVSFQHHLHSLQVAQFPHGHVLTGHHCSSALFICEFPTLGPQSPPTVIISMARARSLGIVM